MYGYETQAPVEAPGETDRLNRFILKGQMTKQLEVQSFSQSRLVCGARSDTEHTEQFPRLASTEWNNSFSASFPKKQWHCAEK